MKLLFDSFAVLQLFAALNFAQMYNGFGIALKKVMDHWTAEIRSLNELFTRLLGICSKQANLLQTVEDNFSQNDKEVVNAKKKLSYISNSKSSVIFNIDNCLFKIGEKPKTQDFKSTSFKEAENRWDLYRSSFLYNGIILVLSMLLITIGKNYDEHQCGVYFSVIELSLFGTIRCFLSNRPGKSFMSLLDFVLLFILPLIFVLHNDSLYVIYADRLVNLLDFSKSDLETVSFVLLLIVGISCYLSCACKVIKTNYREHKAVKSEINQIKTQVDSFEKKLSEVTSWYKTRTDMGKEFPDE